MGLRDFVAVVVSVLTFLGVIVLIGMVVRSFSPDYSPSQHPAERMAILSGSLIAALIVYNLIKGKKPEPKVNVADERDVTSKNISKKLEEKQQKR